MSNMPEGSDQHQRPPISEPPFRLEDPMAAAAAEDFLAGNETGRERLACHGHCLTPELCAAVIINLTQRYENGLVPEDDFPTLDGHGIKVEAYGDEICPGRLVRSAVAREFSGEFSVQDDPLNGADFYTRAAEALRKAVLDVQVQLDRDIRR